MSSKHVFIFTKKSISFEDGFRGYKLQICKIKFLSKFNYHFIDFVRNEECIDFTIIFFSLYSFSGNLSSGST